MRTTLNIEDDILNAAKAIAESTERSISDVVSELLRKALTQTSTTGYRNDIPVFEVGERARPITIDDVKKGEDY